jgi:hypothetical protein
MEIISGMVALVAADPASAPSARYSAAPLALHEDCRGMCDPVFHFPQPTVDPILLAGSAVGHGFLPMTYSLQAIPKK